MSEAIDVKGGEKNQHGLGFWFWHMYFSWACGHQSLPGKLWCFTSSLMKIFKLCLFTHPIPLKRCEQMPLLSVPVRHARCLTAYGFNERLVSSWARISALSLSWLRAQMNIAWMVWIQQSLLSRCNHRPPSIEQSINGADTKSSGLGVQRGVSVLDCLWNSLSYWSVF